jgi:hypothetical protein
MILLVSGASKTVDALYPSNPCRLGRLYTPRTGNSVVQQPDGMVFAYDNDGFKYFDKDRWLERLHDWTDRCVQAVDQCRFVTCPDFVGNAWMTDRLFKSWHGYIHRLGFPVAFVAQNGLERQKVYWRRFEALFIGGDNVFKMAPFAADLIKEAKDKGKWVHVGRVNSIRRARVFLDLGVDSVDGTGFSMFPTTYIPWFMGFLQNPDNPPPQGRQRKRKAA